MSPIRVKINVTKVLKEHLFKGAKGTYLDLFLYPTPGDPYGNDFRVTQDLPKAVREAGVRGAILGNARLVIPAPTPETPAKPACQMPSKPPAPADAEEDDIPF